MKLDAGIVDGGRRVAAPDRLSSAPLGAARDDDDSASIQHIDLAESGVHETARQDSPTLSDELAHALGLPWTRQNPVWTAQALNRMRALQHVLMKQAFSLSQDARSPLLEGVKVLELAICLRVRLEAALHEQQLATLRGTGGSEMNASGMSRDDAADPLVRAA